MCVITAIERVTTQKIVERRHEEAVVNPEVLMVDASFVMKKDTKRLIALREGVVEAMEVDEADLVPRLLGVHQQGEGQDHFQDRYLEDDEATTDHTQDLHQGEAKEVAREVMVDIQDQGANLVTN